MDSKTKVFAFKLAEKREETRAADGKWMAREGLAIAGCTDSTGDFDFRDNVDYPGGPNVGRDAGYWC